MFVPRPTASLLAPSCSLRSRIACETTDGGRFLWRMAALSSPCRPASLLPIMARFLASPRRQTRLRTPMRCRPRHCILPRPILSLRAAHRCPALLHRTQCQCPCLAALRHRLPICRSRAHWCAKHHRPLRLRGRCRAARSYFFLHHRARPLTLRPWPPLRCLAVSLSTATRTERAVCRSDRPVSSGRWARDLQFTSTCHGAFFP